MASAFAGAGAAAAGGARRSRRGEQEHLAQRAAAGEPHRRAVLRGVVADVRDLLVADGVTHATELAHGVARGLENRDRPRRIRRLGDRVSRDAAAVGRRQRARQIELLLGLRRGLFGFGDLVQRTRDRIERVPGQDRFCGLGPNRFGRHRRAVPSSALSLAVVVGTVIEIRARHELHDARCLQVRSNSDQGENDRRKEPLGQRIQRHASLGVLSETRARGQSRKSP